MASRTLVFTGKPDLAVNNADLSLGLPAATGPQSTELLVRVRNEGVLAAQNVLVRVAEGAAVLSEFSVPNIPARSTFTVAFALNLAPGEHTLTATIDPNAVIEETLETNNAATITADVQSQDRADLAILPADIQVSNATPLPGQTVSIAATVRNAGSIVRGDPFVGAELLETFDVAPLAVGGQRTLSTNYVAPAGSSQIFAIADGLFQVNESIESNNIASTTFQSLSLADLRVNVNSLALSHTNLDIGLSVKATLTVDNIGTLPAQSAVIQFGFERGGVETLVGAKDLGLLLPGQSVQTDFFFQPGAGLANLLLKVDPRNGVAELDEINNSATRSVEFAISALTVGIFRSSPDGTVPETAFDAVEVALIQPVYAQTAPDIVLSMDVSNEFGEQFTVRTKATDSPDDPHDIFEFYTSKHRPGRYTARAQARRRIGPGEFQVLTEARRDFILRPTERITAVTPSSNPKTISKGSHSLALFAQVSNASNVDFPVLVQYQVVAPSGTVLVTNSEEKTLAAASGIASIALPEFSHTFSESGPYKIVVNLLKNNVQVGSGSGSFQVEGALRLQAVRSITPTALPPTGSGMINVKIKVEAVGE
jgi:hypothetical protein